MVASRIVFSRSGHRISKAFESEFHLARADKHDNSKRVAELLTKQLGKPTAVSFELIPEEEYKDSVIDDFLENYEN